MSCLDTPPRLRGDEATGRRRASRRQSGSSQSKEADCVFVPRSRARVRIVTSTVLALVWLLLPASMLGQQLSVVTVGPGGRKPIPLTSSGGGYDIESSGQMTKTDGGPRE